MLPFLRSACGGASGPTSGLAGNAANGARVSQENKLAAGANSGGGLRKSNNVAAAATECEKLVKTPTTTTTVKAAATSEATPSHERIQLKDGSETNAAEV